MRLGISSYAYGWAIGFGDARPDRAMTVVDLCERAVQFNVDVLQIADNLAPEDLPRDLRREVASRCADHGIAIELGARRLTQERIEKLAAIAAEMDASIVRFLIDARDYHPSFEDVSSVLRGGITSLPRNLRIAIENHDRFTAVELQRLMQDLACDQVGICLDVANSFGTGEGTETVVRRLSPWTINLHLKDVSICRIDTLMGFRIEGCPAGEGKIDIPWVLEQMTPRCQSVILESWTPRQGDLAETITVEANWVEQSYSYLRTILDKRPPDA